MQLTILHYEWHLKLSILHLSVASESEKRVPNYSSLTARESLENLRRRQQLQLQQSVRRRMAEMGATAFVETDGTYDTINYDLVKARLSAQDVK
jgi:hypothetical protein